MYAKSANLDDIDASPNRRRGRWLPFHSLRENARMEKENNKQRSAYWVIDGGSPKSLLEEQLTTQFNSTLLEPTPRDWVEMIGAVCEEIPDNK